MKPKALPLLAAIAGINPDDVAKTKGPCHPHSFLTKDEMKHLRKRRKKEKAARKARRINR